MTCLNSNAGTTYDGQWDGWYGPSGRDPSYIYDYQNILISPTSLSLQSINHTMPKKAEMADLRRSMDVQCPPENRNSSACKPLEEVCLFNINDDPCEFYNVRPHI